MERVGRVVGSAQVEVMAGWADLAIEALSTLVHFFSVLLFRFNLRFDLV